MSTHNIVFYEDMTKNIFKLTSNIIKYAPYLFFCLERLYIIIPPVYEVYRGYIVIPPVYEVYRGYIVFAFSVCVLVCLCVCKLYFPSKISQELLNLGS